MNRHYEQRLRRLEQKESQESAVKKQWLPQWLLDTLSKDYGLPFDTPETGLESIRRIQKLDKIVVPDDDDGVIEHVDAGSFREARRNAKQGPSLS
jgi:hypothetical protein